MIATVHVDRGALRANVARLRAMVAPARFAAVVKSNAYGHGLALVARAIEADVALFGVYRASEAVALRSAGIRRPILIMGPIAPPELERAHQARAAITLWDAGSYRAEVERVARKAGRRFAVHAKVDTGVTRFGFDPEAAASGLLELMAAPDLQVTGIYTHLAAAEELESGFTREQLARFEQALGPIAPGLRKRGVRFHAAASAAAMLYPDLRLDMVRCGIATYGIWPSPQTRTAVDGALVLEAVLGWTSELVGVREVESGRSVGYGCDYTTTRPSRIGVLPIGYAEGVPRAASNAGAVLIAGRRASIVGRVCMNVTMLDVTDIPAAHPGSRVTLIGADGGDRLDAEDWAGWAGTIAYDIVARLPAEMPRRLV